MKIPKEVYRYIEYELYHYETYKQELQLEKERIMDSSAAPADGQPRGGHISNIPLEKTISLNESTAVLSLQRIVKAVEDTLKGLSDTHTKVFTNYYVKGRKDVYKMCDDIGISHPTFTRYKTDIVSKVGNELGIIKFKTVIKS